MHPFQDKKLKQKKIVKNNYINKVRKFVKNIYAKKLPSGRHKKTRDGRITILQSLVKSYTNALEAIRIQEKIKLQQAAPQQVQQQPQPQPLQQRLQLSSLQP